MKLGEYQELIYIKKVDFGAYLAETEMQKNEYFSLQNRYLQMQKGEIKSESSYIKTLKTALLQQQMNQNLR